MFILHIHSSSRYCKKNASGKDVSKLPLAFPPSVFLQIIRRHDDYPIDKINATEVINVPPSVMMLMLYNLNDVKDK
jgi:hypothetical protein